MTLSSTQSIAESPKTVNAFVKESDKAGLISTWPASQVPDESETLMNNLNTSVPWAAVPAPANPLRELERRAALPARAAQEREAQPVTEERRDDT